MGKKSTNKPVPAGKEQPKSKNRDLISFPVDLIYKPTFLPQLNILSQQIIIITKFFSKEYSNQLISTFSSDLRLETTERIKSKEYALRFNDRISILDKTTSKNLWEYVSKLLKNKNHYYTEDQSDVLSEFEEAKGLNPQLRVYRYQKGQFFDKHYDESVKVDGLGKTKWTLLIYLTGDDLPNEDKSKELVGGDTVFYDELDKRKDPIRISPKKGMALLHRHGDDECMLHEADEVQRGTKWVLRTDIVF